MVIDVAVLDDVIAALDAEQAAVAFLVLAGSEERNQLEQVVGGADEPFWVYSPERSVVDAIRSSGLGRRTASRRRATPMGEPAAAFSFKAKARFADNLYCARERAGLSQKDAAARAALT